jgi:hypothetical protein
MDETGGRRWRDWGVAVTALLALLLAAYTVGFLLGWGSPDARARLTYALYLPLTFGPMLLAWRVAGGGPPVAPAGDPPGLAAPGHRARGVVPRQRRLKRFAHYRRPP